MNEIIQVVLFVSSFLSSHNVSKVHLCFVCISSSFSLLNSINCIKISKHLSVDRNYQFPICDDFGKKLQ